MRSRRHVIFVVVFFSILFLLFFSPVVMRGKLLAFGVDGLQNYLPYFHSHKTRWDRMVFGGFPMMADPQVMTWYPPAALFSQLPGTWNVFVIFAYVAGCCFMYGYVLQLTSSRLAGLISGTTFGLSGFMIAHLVHAVILQTAIWFPLIMWSVESLRSRPSNRWLLLGSFAAAMSLLGGQPQISCYGLILAAAYAVVRGRNAPSGNFSVYRSFILMMLIAVGLSAIQLVPTAELFRHSMRTNYSFEGFVSHSLPPRQLLTLIFPLSFGVRESGVVPYFGAVNQFELTGYLGVLPLMLAALGVVGTHLRDLGWFWAVIIIVALMLVMGDATPLARLIYHIPILSGFRAPARHFFEFTFGASTLAGLGTAAILEQRISANQFRRVLVLATVGVLITLVLLFLNFNHLADLATSQHILRATLLSWLKRTSSVALIVFLLGGVALVWCHQKVNSLPAKIALVSILVIELSSCGWFYEWRYAALGGSNLAAPEIARRYEHSLSTTNQRLLSYDGVYGSVGEIAPNLSRLWGVASAGGCNPMMPSRIGQTLSMTEVGTVRTLPWKEIADSGLDLMAVRYIFMSPDQTIRDAAGGRWFADDWQQWLGVGCDPSGSTSFKVSLPTPVQSTALGVVSRLACSTSVTDGTEVARIRIIDTQDQATTRSVIAGRDTSEWAYDCPNVRPAMRHSRATVFSNYAAKMYDQSCSGHFYVTKLNLDGVKQVKRLEFEWTKNPASLIVEKLSLIDDTSGDSHPLGIAFTQPERWRLVEATAAARVYENLRVMPRVWLANEAVTVTAGEALQTIKSGALKDGRAFDPHRTVLIEEPASFRSSQPDSNASAAVTSLSDTRMEVRTNSSSPTFLVTSDTYYPGWRAMIDGHETRLYRADYAIRGVVVPAGQHLVSFLYRPRSFYAGAAISTLTLFSLSVFGVALRLRRQRSV